MLLTPRFANYGKAVFTNGVSLDSISGCTLISVETNLTRNGVSWESTPFWVKVTRISELLWFTIEWHQLKINSIWVKVTRKRNHFDSDGVDCQLTPFLSEIWLRRNKSLCILLSEWLDLSAAHEEADFTSASCPHSSHWHALLYIFDWQATKLPNNCSEKHVCTWMTSAGHFFHDLKSL